jgi:hypothetical protein
MGLRFHGVHEIVERYAVETIVAKKLQYNLFFNWEANVSKKFISKLLKNPSPFQNKIKLKFGGATLPLVYASNFFGSPTRDFFFFSFSFSFYKTSTCNKSFTLICNHKLSTPISATLARSKDHWSTLAHLKFKNLVNLFWYLKSTSHIPWLHNVHGNI